MELMYTSTRNANEKVTASQAILKGLAEDGGLFVPEQLPTLDKTVDELAGMTYQETAILVVCVVAMFAMTLTSDSPTIVDYQSKLLNRYASWEQELTEREKAVSEKEQELGIQVDTEQTDFTVSP